MKVLTARWIILSNQVIILERHTAVESYPLKGETGFLTLKLRLICRKVQDF